MRNTTSGHIEQQYSCSDKAGAREGTGDIHALAICSPRTMAKGSGGSWPTTNTTGETVCGTDQCKLFRNWLNETRKQLAGRHDWSETDGACLFWVWKKEFMDE